MIHKLFKKVAKSFNRYSLAKKAKTYKRSGSSLLGPSSALSGFGLTTTPALAGFASFDEENSSLNDLNSFMLRSTDGSQPYSFDIPKEDTAEKMKDDKISPDSEPDEPEIEELHRE